jgi:hypothetical protein
MANWFDDLLGGVGAVLDTAGVGYAIGKGIADLDPFGFKKAPSLPPRDLNRAGGSGHPSAPPTTPGAPLIGGGVSSGFQGGFTTGGGASMDWGNDFAMTVSNGGRRGLIPYSGGIIPSGYRVGMRPPRAPTAGYPGGTYLIPRRTMNPLNPRALMRAERRLNAFSTWVKRHFKIAAAAPKRRKGGRFTKRRK